MKQNRPGSARDAGRVTGGGDVGRKKTDLPTGHHFLHNRAFSVSLLPTRASAETRERIQPRSEDLFSFSSDSVRSNSTGEELEELDSLVEVESLRRNSYV